MNPRSTFQRPTTGSSVLERLAHARVLERLEPRPDAHARSSEPLAVERPAAEARTPTAAFERRELAFDLAPAAAGPRTFGDRNLDPRARLLGGCLARVTLPSARELARDLVCLGARGAGRAVFLDLETTGLGAVSVPFVVGLAWIEAEAEAEGRGPGPAAEFERLRLVQWTLGRYGGEAELLADVLARLEALGPAPLLSFNGASFDVPLLRQRARRYGLSARVLDVEHLDLLHPARRMFRGAAGRAGRDCRLATLELDLLGVQRRGDLESAEIPEVFWTWVQSPNDAAARRRLQAVCDHNLADLASLPALAARLGAAIRNPDDVEGALRAARHLDKHGAAEQARLLLSRFVASGGAGGPRWREAALELAAFERRAGQRERAAVLWRAAWTADPGCPIASEAWAKHLEHQVGDFAAALRVARASRQPCAHRIARLEARLRRRGRGLSAGPTSSESEPIDSSNSSNSSESSQSPGAPAKLLTRIDESERGAIVRYCLLR